VCETLPAPMLARLSALGAELATVAQRHRDAPLEDQERAVLEAVRGALPELLGAVLRLSLSSLDPRQGRLRHACPACGAKARVQGWRERRVRTICGEVAFERPWCVCPGCGAGWSPADAALGLAPRARLSAGLDAWVARVGAQATSFARAGGLLGLLAGLDVGPETVRRRAERTGAALEAGQQAAIAHVAAEREAAGPTDPAPGTLVVEADGVQVRYTDGWHEVKVGLVGGLVDRELTAPSYVAAREGPDRFGPRLLAEAARRGALEVVGWEHAPGDDPADPRVPPLAVLREVAVLGDGAPWIWGLAAEHFGRRHEVVDFFHAAEHAWAAARALHGPDAPEARAWAEARVHELRDHGAGPVLAALAAAEPPSPEAAEALRKERGYFETNAPRMDYPAVRAAGLPLGSGPVESAAKHVVQQRLKVAGARWSEPGARAMLTLCAHLASGRPLTGRPAA
jgi:hypothetical protein